MTVIRRVLETGCMGFGNFEEDCFQQKRFSKQVFTKDAHRILHAPAAPSRMIYRMVSRAPFYAPLQNVDIRTVGERPKVAIGHKGRRVGSNGNTNED